MLNKRYTANNRQGLLLILMLAEDGQLSIEFKSGYGIRNEAYFMTNDPMIQEAMESDKRFNVSYRLSDINGMDISEYNARKDIAASNEVNGTPTPEVKGLIPMSFATAQVCKEWLHKDYEIPFHLLANKGKIVEKAKELGYEITFENENK